ncbi:superoxide dismutase [Micractinium conductrix]|uniref:Superoxide dismutase n=1 Tax=Micractinium conductrix TaxID=554055 RepID=A0A2P6VME2_9CHLO|nr:superoxide dismutase [Micractinium conductrix]|eukprot:PSC75227.1 superoxide dismutase [Micractinium conductrix]
MARALLVAALVAALAGHAAAASFTNFTFPALPYDANAMEPSIDAATMVLHSTRYTTAFFTHAATFATRLNDALLTSCKGQGLHKKSLYELNTLTAIRNNAGGLWNHGLFFFSNLAPTGSQTYPADASPALKAAINHAFGSFERFQVAISEAATGVFGSGWAWLIADGRGRVGITATPNQDNPLMGVARTRGSPLLGLDVWEHAYYLKYNNRRGEYIAGFYSVINWRRVSQLYATVLARDFDEVDVLKP